MEKKQPIKTPHDKADELIKMLTEHGMSSGEMLKVLRLARTMLIEYIVDGKV